MDTRISIADDTAFMRKTLADIFAGKGCSVIGKARNSKEAIRLYTELKPDIVIINVVMSGANSIETTR